MVPMSYEYPVPRLMAESRPEMPSMLMPDVKPRTPTSGDPIQMHQPGGHVLSVGSHLLTTIPENRSIRMD